MQIILIYLDILKNDPVKGPKVFLTLLAFLLVSITFFLAIDAYMWESAPVPAASMIEVGVK